MGRKEPATGAHDPLWAKALVLDNGDQRIGIVSIDTLVVTGQFTARVRQELASRWGIPAENVLINTTHTHSAPDVFGMHSPRNAALEQQLLAGVVAAVEAACAGLVTGRVVAERQELLVGVTISQRAQPIQLPHDRIEKLEEACRTVEADYVRMISRTAHDAMYLGQHGPVSMLFIRNVSGVSHSPAETTTDEDVTRGATVLATYLAWRAQH